VEQEPERTGPAEFEAYIKREAARLQAILDERDRRAVEDRKQKIRDTIARDAELIEAGRLITHICPKCLEGYVSYDIERFCHEGQGYVLRSVDGK
jgi:hypothetical protein